MSVQRIDVRERVMARNDLLAATVRDRLAAAGVAAVNLISSPGAGKTTLLEQTLDHVGRAMRLHIVTGDVQTQNDADRLARHTDRLVHAVVTQGGCHLDAAQVSAAIDQIDLHDTDLLVLENVGNLVCPASWDLGEGARVTLFSVTEGEDKPVKYPKAFALADLVLVTKIDLLPHLRFDLSKALSAIRAVNETAPILCVSAESGAGMDDWLGWLHAQVSLARRAAPAVA
ncbi:MAG: hydrogenase nickel incorporation protein HypB [Gemmatimonadaceae bacterium]|jgi:hydrogenase nickel incorporation protein HypB|nr:hydrogenase nickel incorporation protein HypB [Gemmatimonadaceae bacterium]